MKTTKIYSLILFLFPAFVFSQPTVWKSFYSKGSFNNIMEDGNYIRYYNTNQMVQFDKNNNYFTYSKLPDDVLPCNSLHNSFQVTGRELAKDNNGNIWLLTSNSINRFDGSVWNSWDASFFNNGMSFSSVYDLMIDRNNIVWLTSNTHGIIRFDGTSYLAYDTLNSLLPSYNFYARLTTDTAGDIWFCNIDTGIVKFDGNNFTYYNNSTIGYPGSNGTYIYGIYVNPLTNELYCTSGGDGYYYHYNGSNWQQLELDTNVTGLSYNGNINFVFFDATGNTYFSVASGIVKYDGNTYTLLTNFPNYVADYNYVEDAKIDANGIMWLILNRQLVRFDGQNFNTYNDPRAVLQSNVMLPQMIDKDRNHWMGYWGSGGLTKEVAHNFSSIPQSTDPILCMTMDSAKRLWFGTGSWNSLHYYYNDTIIDVGTSVSAPCTFAGIGGITIDKNNTVWIIGNVAGACDGFAKVDHDSISVQSFMLSGHPQLSCISADSANNIWVGTIGDTQGVGTPGQGLVRYTNGNFTLYNHSNSGLPEDEIQTISVDAQNRIWVGTVNEGVAIFDGSSWTVYNTSNSPMPDNHIEWITFKNGKTYIATQNNGFAVFDGTFWEVYTTDNSGLVNEDCESIVVDDQCNVWVATECGLSEMVGTCGVSALKVLYGTVSSNNNPVTGTEVFLMKYDAGSNSLKIIDDTKTDVNGQYNFATNEAEVYLHAVPNPKFYADLMPAYQDTALVQQNAVPVQLNSSALEKNILCDAVAIHSSATLLTGTVIKENGQKASGIRLFLMQSGKPVATTVTGIKGEFAFADLQAGTYAVWVDKLGVNNTVAPTVSIGQNSSYANMKLHDTWLELILTSVPEISNESVLQLFPNPANNQFRFNLPANNGKVIQLDIIDVEGRKVLSQALTNGTTGIDVSMLSNGVYLVRANTGSTVSQQKLIIQK